ncbi:MAG: radical SAM family heme chaperone HemW [Chloroflexi bacterium]|nr:radical SAM family heme chaperone HemW [Chloroflexota bacterium]
MTHQDRLSLYLHIPFCRHRCSYCDFNTYTSLGDLQESYTQALIHEIHQVAPETPQTVHTIFFGGGTPSLMTAVQIHNILHTIRNRFNLADDAEVTMEANPGTVSLDYLTAVHQSGVNRISFGVQSVIPSELALLEREHDFETVIDAVAMARMAGIDNFNLDLIYGVPGQTLTSWDESVHTVLQLKPHHLSLYCLTIEPGTPMNRWLQNGRFAPPDPDLAADQYELAGDILAEKGFEQYEISNWSLPNRECEHNLTYWRNGDYLGLGAGAHGQANGVRYHVVKQPRVYIRRLQTGTPKQYPLSTAVAGYHKLDAQEAMSNTIITQLRLLQEGLDLDAFAIQFGQTLDDAYNGTMSQLIEWGLLKIEENKLLLTKNGRFISNQVFHRLI